MFIIHTKETVSVWKYFWFQDKMSSILMFVFQVSEKWSLVKKRSRSGAPVWTRGTQTLKTNRRRSSSPSSLLALPLWRVRRMKRNLNPHSFITARLRRSVTLWKDKRLIQIYSLTGKLQALQTQTSVILMSVSRAVNLQRLGHQVMLMRNHSAALSVGENLVTAEIWADTWEPIQERNLSAALSVEKDLWTVETCRDTWGFTRKRNRSAALSVDEALKTRQR